MQIVTVAHSGMANPLDVISYYSHKSEPESGVYVLDPHPVEKVDFGIYSVHDSELEDLDASKKIAVVSYVPTMNSKEWPAFYIALCAAEIIAADSHVLKELEAITYPSKPAICLDGINPIAGAIEQSESTEDGIPMACIQSNPVFWNAYSNWLFHNKMDDKNPLGIYPVDSINDAIVVYGTVPIGQLLSNTLSANKRVWLAYDKHSSLYLDSRLTHNYAPKIARMLEIAGSAQAQVANELFETMTDELSNLLVHAAASEVPMFYSSTTLVSRIMNEVNRAI